MTLGKQQVNAPSGTAVGTGSSIQGKIFRDNVGKLPWAAGAEYDLQGLFERGSMPKEERAQREWHMSPYERGQGGNALGGDGNDVSPMEVTPKLGKGAQDTWRFPSPVRWPA